MKRSVKLTLAGLGAAALLGLVYIGATEEGRERDACKGRWDSTEGTCVISIGGAQ